jgi:tripartite ATP-independent transporter DctP family solute receptor
MHWISRREFALGASAVALATGAYGRASAAAPEMRQFHNQTADSTLHRRLSEMWDAVAQETSGRVRVRVFPRNGNLPGADPQARDMLIAGELEFYTLMGGVLGEAVPIADIQGIPFAFRDHAQVYRALDGDLGELLRAEAEAKGIYVVPKACFENGFRHITTSTRPIRTVADLQGMRIRIPASRVFADTFLSLGAEPVMINSNRIYEAVRTGEVEAQENPFAIIDGFKLYEVQRYCSLTAHMWSGFNLLANLAVWRGLTEDARESIARNAAKYAALQRADNIALAARLKDDLARRGMIFNEADVSGFRPRLADFYRRWKARLGARAWAMLEAHVGRLG